MCTKKIGSMQPIHPSEKSHVENVLFCRFSLAPVTYGIQKVFSH